LRKKLLQEVANEYAKGLDFLSWMDRHWRASTLSELTMRPISYLKGWLWMIQVLRCYQQQQSSEVTVVR